MEKVPIRSAALARLLPRLLAHIPAPCMCPFRLDLQIVDQTMKTNGFTKGNLILMLCYAVFLLMLIFIFIFVGVAAFTGAGTLGAIINSLLAAGSGEHSPVCPFMPGAPCSWAGPPRRAVRVPQRLVPLSPAP